MRTSSRRLKSKAFNRKEREGRKEKPQRTRINQGLSSRAELCIGFVDAPQSRETSCLCGRSVPNLAWYAADVCRTGRRHKVPRLRMILRFAPNHASLGMTE